MANIMMRKTLDNVMFELDDGWFAMVLKDEDIEDAISFYVKYDRCPWLYCKSDKVEVDFWFDLSEAEGRLMDFIDEEFEEFREQFVEEYGLDEDIIEECQVALEWQDF